MRWFDGAAWTEITAPMAQPAPEPALPCTTRDAVWYPDGMAPEPPVPEVPVLVVPVPEVPVVVVAVPEVPVLVVPVLEPDPELDLEPQGWPEPGVPPEHGHGSLAVATAPMTRRAARLASAVAAAPVLDAPSAPAPPPPPLTGVPTGRRAARLGQPQTSPAPGPAVPPVAPQVSDPAGAPFALPAFTPPSLARPAFAPPSLAPQSLALPSLASPSARRIPEVVGNPFAAPSPAGGVVPPFAPLGVPFATAPTLEHRAPEGGWGAAQVAGRSELEQRPGADPHNPLHWVVPLGRSWQSIVAGYLGLIGLLVWPLAPLAVGLGVWAMVRARSGGHGRGRAVFAIIAGVLGTALGVLVLLVWGGAG